MSGAGRIKHDGSDSDILYEIKTADKQYTIKASEAGELWRRAVQQEKEPLMIIEFGSGLQAVVWLTQLVSEKFK